MKAFQTYLNEGALKSKDMDTRNDYRDRLVKMIKAGDKIKLQAGGEVVLKYANDDVKKVLEDKLRAPKEISKVGIEYRNKLYKFKGSDRKFYKLTHIMKSGQFSAAAGFKDPGKPSGADWENLITKAFNEMSGKTDKKTGYKPEQWNYEKPAGTFPIQEAAKELANEFAKLGTGTMVQFGAGSKGEKPEKPTERVSKFWKDAAAEVGATVSSIPKTDMLIGSTVKISLKKSGGSQTGSPTKGEAYATFQAASELVGENEKGQLGTLLAHIKDDWKTIHSDINARDVSSAVKKDVKTAKSEKEKERARVGKGAEVQALPNQDDVKQILSQSAKHKDMSPTFTNFFNNNTMFKDYFVYEAASGYKKFSGGEATANKMVEFNPYSRTLTQNINIGMGGIPSGEITSYSNSIKFDVGFKSSGGSITSSIRLIKDEKEWEAPTFKDIVEHSIQEMDFSDLYTLHEDQRFLDEAAWFRAKKDKISSIWDKIWDKTKKILDRIIALGKKALKAIMKFFGVEVDYVKASGPDIIFGKMA